MINKKIIKSAMSLWVAFPSILGVILLISLMLAVIPKTFYILIFSKNIWLDIIIGGIAGSISAGNPITSYIIGGELLSQGVNLLVVTIFIVTWVTVGLIQLPAEIMFFGKKFAIYRNLLSFLFAIVVSLITVWLNSLF